MHVPGVTVVYFFSEKKTYFLTSAKLAFLWAIYSFFRLPFSLRCNSFMLSMKIRNNIWQLSGSEVVFLLL